MRETEKKSDEAAGRETEATSKETLSDLKEHEKISDSKTEPSGEGSVPTPDGELDDSGDGRADGSDTGGPM